jgi:Mn-dependent DtxR family transcriptional regulator
MTVADSSIAAYHEHRDSGALSRQKKELLQAVLDGRDYSRRELAEATGILMSSVCGAVNELIKRGFLVHGPQRKCTITGKTINPVSRPTKAAP